MVDTELVITLYGMGINQSKIATILGCSQSRVSQIINKKKLTHPKKISSILNKKVLEYAKNGLSGRDIAKKLSLKPYEVRDVLVSHGFTYKKHFEIDKTMFAEHRLILDINLHYWLGFILANGSLSTEGKITVGSIYKTQIEKLKSFFGLHHKIITNKKGRKRYYYSISFRDTEIYDNLLSFGFPKHKKNGIEQLSEFLYSSKDFWRGYIDGNGSLYLQQGDVFLSVSGHKSILLLFLSYINSYVTSTKVQPHHTKSSWYINFSYIKSFIILKHLYTNAGTYLEKNKELIDSSTNHMYTAIKNKYPDF